MLSPHGQVHPQSLPSLNLDFLYLAILVTQPALPIFTRRVLTNQPTSFPLPPLTSTLPKEMEKGPKTEFDQVEFASADEDNISSQHQYQEIDEAKVRPISRLDERARGEPGPPETIRRPVLRR